MSPIHTEVARAGNHPDPIIFRYQALYRPDIYDDEPWIVIRERQEADGWIADRHVCTYKTEEDAFRVLDELNAPKEIDRLSADTHTTLACAGTLA